MNPRAQRRRQTDVAGYDQRQPAIAADLGEIAAESHTVGCAVVAEDDARQTAWQALRGGTRVGHAARVGEQPEGRNARAGAGHGGMRPSENSFVHGVSGLACATRTVVLTRSGP
jgi:hypothetical protein